MFSFTIDGRQLADDWEPFKFSREQFRSRQLEHRPKFFDESWFKEMPISRLLDREFDTKGDGKDSGSAAGATDVATEPISAGQTIQLGLHRPKLFDDPWFKDFLGDEDSTTTISGNRKCTTKTTTTRRVSTKTSSSSSSSAIGGSSGQTVELGVHRPRLFDDPLFKELFGEEGESENKERAVATETKDAAIENFKVTFETGDFEPEEIDVTLDGAQLKIHGKKSSSSESREMLKYYTLPDTVNKDELSSCLSKDGFLQVTAPFKETQEAAARSECEVEVPLVDFKPENIKVTVDGRRVKVHAKKADEKVGEEVTRWFTLPETASNEGLVSSVDADGSIVIQVPWMSGGGSLAISVGEAADGQEGEK